MIFRLVKRDPGALLNVSQHLAGKIDIPVQTGANGGATERELAQNFDRFLRPLLSVSNLLRVTGKFLAESDRRRIHQMRPPNLDNLPKLLRLRVQCAMQFSERRHQMILQLLGGADVNGRRNDIVARLTHVDVIIRMHELARADFFAGQLRATIGDHFICVRVGARARTGLENIEWKMVVQFAIDHFFRCLHDQGRPLGVE